MQELSGAVSTGSRASTQHELQTPSKVDVRYSTINCSTTTNSSADILSGASATPKEASRLTLLNGYKIIICKANANFYLLVSYFMYVLQELCVG